MMLRVLNVKKYDMWKVYKYLLFEEVSKSYIFGTDSKYEMKMKLDLLGAKIGSAIFQRLSGKLFCVDIKLV